VTNPALQAFLEVFATRTPGRTEADVQHAIASFLRVAQLGLEDQQVVSLEQQLQDGTRRRIDIAHGHLLIEVKENLSPGTLSEAEPQLNGYVTTRESQWGIQLAGILTDGLRWRLYDSSPDGLVLIADWTVNPADPDACERLSHRLGTIMATGDRLPVTPSEIELRLGSSSPRYLLNVARLRHLFRDHAQDPTVALKRDLWARLLRTALGSNFEDDEQLFVDHTLLVIEAEVIAHLVLGLHPEQMSPMDIVSGATFRLHDVFGVVESDFFDWPAEVDGGDAIIADIVRELAQFDWTQIDHDVLKHLYESIISPERRKKLGEYYTPDWLALAMLDEVVSDPLNQRVMDPACGSGTFIFHAIRKVLDAAETSGMTNKAALNLVQERVFGLDIHPVSTALARVTYLLAIGSDRLLQDRDPINIPVFLGDSIQWARDASTYQGGVVRIEVEGDDLATAGSDSIPTLIDVGDSLEFPLAPFPDPSEFDSLVSDLAGRASSYTDQASPVPVISDLLAKHPTLTPDDREVLNATFATLCRLNAEGRDHIWGFYVRNQVRPLAFSMPAHQVDVLIGNPPWLAYRFMTRAMQRRLKALAVPRGIWSGGNVATTQDLVSVFIVRVIEHFLKPDGKFGFVTPKAVLSRTQYSGFRAGNWLADSANLTIGTHQDVNVHFGRSWDLSGVRPQPFPVPAAVLFGKRSDRAVSLTPDSTRWSGSVRRGLTRADATVVQLVSGTGHASPYGSKVRQGATLSPRVAHYVQRLPPGPLGLASGITLVESARSSIEKAPWKQLPSIKGPVEDETLHPLAQGSSILPFRLGELELTALPIANGVLLDQTGRASYPRFAERWAAAESVWEANKTASSGDLMSRLDYMGKLSAQLNPGAHRLLIPAHGNRLLATRLDDPSVIVGNKAYWLELSSVQEGQYLQAILNSTPMQEFVTVRQSEGLYGARDIHTLPWVAPIPGFDPTNPLHVELSVIGERAEVEAQQVDVSSAPTFQRARALIKTALADIILELDDLVVRLLT